MPGLVEFCCSKMKIHFSGMCWQQRGRAWTQDRSWRRWEISRWKPKPAGLKYCAVSSFKWYKFQCFFLVGWQPGGEEGWRNHSDKEGGIAVQSSVQLTMIHETGCSGWWKDRALHQDQSSTASNAAGGGEQHKDAADWEANQDCLQFWKGHHMMLYCGLCAIIFFSSAVS